MLEVKTFVCEKCGRRYGKPEIAACCEQGHETPTHIGEYIRYKPANKFPDLIEIMFGQKKAVYRRVMGCSRPLPKKKNDDDDEAMFDFDNDDDED